jgi:hypothetical protein
MVAWDDTLEVWRPIDGYPGYEVSSHGRVRSLTRTVETKNGQVRLYEGQILRQRIMTTNGIRYYMVRTWQQGIGVSHLVHVLVCTAFSGPRPSPAHQVAHWDNNSLYNRRSNLRWTTAQGNADDRARHGTVARGSRQGSSKLTEADVIAIRRALDDGARGIDLAEQYGVSRATISMVNTGTRWAWLP